jgi:hypothetical protein
VGDYGATPICGTIGLRAWQFDTDGKNYLKA